MQMFPGTTFTSSASPCNLLLAVLRKSLTVTFCSAVLFGMVGNAYALSQSAKSGTSIKKKVVTTETVTGPSIKCHQWGFMVVQLKVVKTEITSAHRQAEGVDQDHERQLADLPGSHAEVEVHQRSGAAAPAGRGAPAPGQLGNEAREHLGCDEHHGFVADVAPGSARQSADSVAFSS